jgi:hypothetical protein
MKEDGFEYKLPDEDDSTFFRWSVSDGGKDIKLIDKFTEMPLHEFFAVVEDSFDRSRGTILLAMVATSIRAERPDWTPERIIRTVQNLNLSDITFIDADEDDAGPPPLVIEAASTGESSSEDSSA